MIEIKYPNHTPVNNANCTEKSPLDHLKGHAEQVARINGLIESNNAETEKRRAAEGSLAKEQARNAALQEALVTEADLRNELLKYRKAYSELASARRRVSHAREIALELQIAQLKRELADCSKDKIGLEAAYEGMLEEVKRVKHQRDTCVSVAQVFGVNLTIGPKGVSGTNQYWPDFKC